MLSYYWKIILHLSSKDFFYIQQISETQSVNMGVKNTPLAKYIVSSFKKINF